MTTNPSLKALVQAAAKKELEGPSPASISLIANAEKARSVDQTMVSIVTDPIEGTWLPFKAELAGEPAPHMVLAKTYLIIRAGHYAVHFGGEVTDEGSYTLSAAEEFHIITLASTCGTNAGRTIPSIYQLNGNRLRICYGLDGIAPPAFVSACGSEHYLVSYRRKT